MVAISEGRRWMSEIGEEDKEVKTSSYQGEQSAMYVIVKLFCGTPNLILYVNCKKLEPSFIASGNCKVV